LNDTAGKNMPPSLRLPRFEITLKTDGQNFKHICAATDQDTAVERVMRPYKSKNPTLLKIKPLGVMRETKRS
jgi:hypothetical protein